MSISNANRTIVPIIAIALAFTGFFLFQGNPFAAGETSDKEPNFLEIINNSKLDGRLAKATSFISNKCHLTWVEKWEWPEEKLCVSDHQQLVAAYSLNFSVIDVRRDTKVRQIKSTSEALSILALPSQTPDFQEDTSFTIETAEEASALLETKPNAVAGFLKMCGIKSRIFGDSGIVLFAKQGTAEPIIEALRHYENKCNQ